MDGNSWGHFTSAQVVAWLGRGLAAVVAGALIAALSVAAPAFADTAPAPDSGLPTTVTADPLPTVQIDGIAWAQAATSTTVYAGGKFSNARPAGAAAGQNQTPRTNLLAYNLATGDLISSWNPTLNGRVLALAVSPDGSRVYVGGDFTTVNGQTRNRIAALDATTGQLIASWAPPANSTVIDIVATDTTVYVAGEFSNINGVSRSNVAALSASTGAVLNFNAVLAGGHGARAIVLSPDKKKLVVAGSFTSTNGSTNPGRGMAALDAVTGQSLPWAVNSVIHNGGDNSAIYSLASDGDSVYGSGYDFYGDSTLDDFEGAFRASWSDGTMSWMEDCHGDTYSVYPFAGAVYTASHSHYCGNIGEFPQLDPWYVSHSLAFDKNPSDRKITPDIYGYRSFTGNTAGRLLHWYPRWGTGTASGIAQAGWDITASGNYLLYGGEFTSVSGVKQQGLVRFAKAGVVQPKVGPFIKGGAYKISTQSYIAGQAKISWDANYDPDNVSLKYEVLRRNTTQPLYTTVASSTYWIRPHMSFVDTTVTAGQTYDYRVRVTDPDGNWTYSDWTPVTISSENAGNSYSAAVLDSKPTHYWPLGESSGTAAYDWAGGNDMTLSTNAVRSQQGQVQVAGETSHSTSFTGSSSFGTTTTSETGPQVFSLEAWFKTSSTTGGKIAGFGNSSSGNSSSYDRHIYLDGSGRVSFGTYPGDTRTLSSPGGFNDGTWHQVVGTLGPDGMSLFVDGVRVGSRADTVSAQAYNGYWRVGGDSIGSWPNSGADYLNGQIADVAVYDKVLTADQVDTHWTASGRASSIPAAPADAYGAAIYGLDPILYWRLGDTTGSTAKDSGRQASPGTYSTVGSANIQRGQAGALANVDDTAIRFTSSQGADGTWSNRQSVVSQRQYASPTSFAVEGWFKTTSSGGGKLIGFENSNGDGVNASSSYDRHVYMDSAGHLKFGVWTGQAEVLTAPSTYNDGSWHYVVAQQSNSGMQLYVDGNLAASNGNASAQPFEGYWRVGGGSGWEGNPFWTGTIDEVAVYGAPLSATQIQQHYQLGLGTPANVAPTASFTSNATALKVDVDGSASTDPDGTIASYDWDFGDTKTGTGKTTSHTYDQAGTYTVTLKVTDDKGATNSTTKTVTVAAAAGDVVAEDDFDRSVTNGWGSAEVGGSWTPVGGSAAFSVQDGQGKVALAPSASRDVKLNGVDALSSVTEVTFSSTQAMNGGAASVSFYARTVGADSYSGRVRFETDGTLRLYLLRNQTALTSVLLPGTYTPGDQLTVKLSVQGSSPTALAMKVWKTADQEPAQWQVQATDATAALQHSGSSMMRLALSATASGSTEFLFDRFVITGTDDTTAG